MAFTQQQINDALIAELAARPGTTYDQMLAHATSTYDLTPAQVTEAYNAMSRAGNTVLVDTGEDGGPGTLHVDPGTVVDTTWWPDTPVYDPSRPPGSTNTSTGNNTNINTRVNTATTDLPLPAQLQRMNVDFGDGTAAVNPNWQNRVTVGAAGSDMLGAGAANYNSELIKNLRIASAAPRSNNPGVSMIPNGAALPFSALLPGGNETGANAFTPEIQDLDEWDPSPIFREIYGRDPTEKELRDTRFLSEKDLRKSLNYWWDLYQKQQDDRPGLLDDVASLAATGLGDSP